MSLPPSEIHYQWKIYRTVEFDEEAGPRLLTPRPNMYEYDFDLQFESVEKANEALVELDVLEEATRDEWVLVQVTLRPVRVLCI